MFDQPAEKFETEVKGLDVRSAGSAEDNDDDLYEALSSHRAGAGGRITMRKSHTCLTERTYNSAAIRIQDLTSITN